MKKLYYPISVITVNEVVNDEFVTIDSLIKFAESHGLDKESVGVDLSNLGDSTFVPMLVGTRPATEQEKKNHYEAWAADQRKRIEKTLKRLSLNEQQVKDDYKRLKKELEMLKKPYEEVKGK